MSILTRETGIPQFRCLPLNGRKDEFRYVQMLNGAWEPINHDDTAEAVGNFNSEMNQGGAEMKPADFIHKHIVKQLLGEGYPQDVALRGADKGVEYYHRSSQASRKGRMFDDCLYFARQEARFQTPQNERKPKPARNSKNRQEKLL
nr:hypothetical protein [Pantoea cypripedii]